MNTTNGKVLLTCDLNQKDKILIDGVEFSTANEFDTNYRERSPVVATVAEDNDFGLRKGSVLILHHNSLYSPSPFHVEENLFSIPANGNMIFAKVQRDGSLLPILGNLFIERIPKPSLLEVPPELQELYLNKFKVIDGGYTRYRNGQIVFGIDYAFYEIVYSFAGEIRRIHRTHEDKLVGYKV